MRFVESAGLSDPAIRHPKVDIIVITGVRRVSRRRCRRSGVVMIRQDVMGKRGWSSSSYICKSSVAGGWG